MDHIGWLKANCRSLEGKTAAITGPTGGIGVPICRMLLQLSARLILLSRDREKTARLIEKLYEEFPQAHIFWVPLDLESRESVASACRELSGLPVDILIHNAGVYQVENTRCSSGFYRVFQTNFLAPYALTWGLLPHLEQRHGKVIVVGSIAAGYRRTDPRNPQYTGRRCHLIYGNSKRYLMYAAAELLQQHPGVRFAIAHPGLAYTSMSNHFTGLLRRLLDLPMRVLYMKPEMAARSIVRAVSLRVPDGSWVGPRWFRIWGNPAVKPVKGCSKKERQSIYRSAEKMRKKFMEGFSAEQGV